MKAAQRHAVALWIVLTYLHDAVEILAITCPDQECGTTLLKLVFGLSNRPLSASNISAAAIYRAIGDACPCLTLDEADSYMKEDEVIRGVLNSGHERQMAFVIRVINDRGDTAQFPTWCPKAIAMIGLPRRTILSRSIHIRLERKDRNTKLPKLRRRHYAELGDLRPRISRLANDIREQVRNFESDDALGNPAGDNWEPLFAIASTAGEDWLRKAERPAEFVSGKDAPEVKSFNKHLLESLGRIVAARREAEKEPPSERLFLGTHDLLNELDLLPRITLDPWRGDAPMILTESRSLAGVLRHVAREYRGRIASTNGQVGGFLHTDIAPMLEQGARVLYLGDYDRARGPDRRQHSTRS